VWEKEEQAGEHAAASVEIVSCSIDVREATGVYANEAVTPPFLLAQWWRDGMELTTTSHIAGT
jgi:hypothetical protein